MTAPASCAANLGLKGSQVQILSARPIDETSSLLISVAFTRLQQLARAKQLEAVMAKPEEALPLVLPGIVGEHVLTLRRQTIVDEL